jgi:maleylacetate reductase
MTDPLPANFAYTTHEVRVTFGTGAIEMLPAELERCGIRNVLLLTTPGRPAERERLCGKVGGELAGTYAGAWLHVPDEVIADAREVVQRLQPAGLLAFGGGSAIGLGKALAFETRLPLAAVPTTYSGSEMTAIWGSSDGKAKRTFRDTHVAPRLVLYDPALTYDLATAVSAASGMNAIAHCVEAEYAPESGPVVSWFASEGVRRLASGLPRVVDAPSDAHARADALFGAHLAGRALDMTSMGLHHKLAHILGGSFGLGHAEAHAALLPWVTAYNAPSAPAAMARIAAALGVDDAAAGLVDLSRRIGIRTLGELGLHAEAIPQAARMAASLSFPNPRAVDEDGVRWILEHALEVPRLAH